LANNSQNSTLVAYPPVLLTPSLFPCTMSTPPLLLKTALLVSQSFYRTLPRRRKMSKLSSESSRSPKLEELSDSCRDDGSLHRTRSSPTIRTCLWLLCGRNPRIFLLRLHTEPLVIVVALDRVPANILEQQQARLHRPFGAGR